MAALTKDRATAERDGRLVADPLAAGVVLFAGGMYVLNGAGAATPATAAATTAVRAVARQRALAAQGDVADGVLGVFCFDNSAGADALARADIGAACFAADDQTVKKTGTCRAGLVLDVDAAGVWVRVGA